MLGWPGLVGLGSLVVYEDGTRTNVLTELNVVWLVDVTNDVIAEQSCHRIMYSIYDM